jgi:hypothetical protein
MRVQHGESRTRLDVLHDERLQECALARTRGAQDVHVPAALLRAERDGKGFALVFVLAQNELVAFGNLRSSLRSPGGSNEMWRLYRRRGQMDE